MAQTECLSERGRVYATALVLQGFFYDISLHREMIFHFHDTVEAVDLIFFLFFLQVRRNWSF